MGRAHKETNTYRFKNFTDRIKEKHIDVVHQLRPRIVEDTGEESTYFGDSLSKWLDLNCTQSFVDFQEEIEKYPCASYVQLVHNAEPLLQVLIKHLQIPETMALEPLLDLLVQMARDVGPDFYQHFHGVFRILLSLLDKYSRDFTALERVFETMAFLYKFLWRLLVRDIKTVYGYFSELLKSSKEHIRRFAAESFAFLMRKVKDKRELLQFLFVDLQSSNVDGNAEPHSESIQEKEEGVARLLFEMIKGVKDHFHSCSEEVFQAMLHALGQPLAASCDLVERIVKHVMEECASHSTTTHAKHLWKLLLAAVSEAQKGNKQLLLRLLRLSSVWLNVNFIPDPSALALVLMCILKDCSWIDEVGVLLSAVSSLLLQSSDQLSVEICARLVALVFAGSFSLREIEAFSQQLFQSAIFEKDVLPGLLSFLSRHFDSASDTKKSGFVSVLADIILRKLVIPEDGSQLERLQCYPLDFGRILRGQRSTFIQHIQTVVKQAVSISDREQLRELFYALVCLPHISMLDSGTSGMDIVSAFHTLQKALNEKCDVDRGSIMFVLRQAVLSLLVLRDRVDIYQLLPPADLVALLKLHPDKFHVLQAADLYLTSEFMCPDLLEELYLALEPNLVSGSHKVRLCTLHILSLFTVVVPGTATPDGEVVEDEHQWNIFTVSLAAERVPLTVTDYRQKLMYLRKMEQSIVHAIMPAGPFKRMPVFYLMGNLLSPLTLIWEPVCELIASHARGLEKDNFWDPFSHWLTFATEQAVKSLENKSDNTVTCNDIIEKWMMAETQSERRPDYTVFRNLLWRAMSLFPEKCEPKSKVIVPLFLEFLQKEYYVKDLSVAPSENIKREEKASVAGEAEANETDENRVTHVAEETNKKKFPNKKDVKKTSAVQSLLAHLELFSKMRNPKSLHKEDKLRDIYFQFLEHKHSKVQTMSFRCIMTYKHKFLVPYRENFERLLDDKTFKSEIVLFSIDQEVTQISSEHRQDLIPFLLRILYGKMLSKTGTETAGKRKADVRRSIVFRFLAGCTAAEMQQFLYLVFGPLKSFVTDDPLKMVKECFAVDITNVIPPKRLKGVLGAVMMTEKLGSLLEDNARSILHLLLGVAATCAACIEHRDVLKPSAASVLKSVRQMVFARLIQFFQEFDKFQFTDQDLAAIMEACVWHQLDRFQLESKCQPSPLLKLIHTWCQDPRYFPFLTKEAPQGDNSPLQAMFSLLITPGVGKPVSAIILKSVESLLVGEEDEDEPPNKRRKSDVVEKLEYMGVQLVRPHVPALLTFIEGAVCTMGAQLAAKGGKEAASKEALLELKILARISIYIDDESQAVRLCSLLMPFLNIGFSLQQDLEESTLESILNLMSVVKSPRSFFNCLVPLFVSIERRQSRVLLCQAFKVIGMKEHNLAEITDAVANLNAWNPRQAEEPDYTARLNTFKNVMQQMKDWTVLDVNFVMPLIYNCCFFIKTFPEDFSIRENATLCLMTIVQCFKGLNSDPNLYKEVIANVILPQVKKGLRSKNENVRHEFLAVLQSLVMAFPDQRDFLGLAGLQDVDMDADFFENIKSIQLHKQAKALRRLSHYLRTHRLRPDQHLGFFVPLVYAYVFNEKKYGKSGKLLDAVMDLTCMTCRQLPWESYYQLLRLYLSHLPRHLDLQRTIVRMIVAILDGFHFDLMQSQFKFSARPKLNDNVGKELESTPAVANAETLPVLTIAEAVEKADDKEIVDLGAIEEEADQMADGKEAATEGDESVAVEYTADRKDLCAPGLATRIHRMILQKLIPQLHKTLTEKVKSDEIHKLAGVKYAEDEEILRVPIAMAMIKLLQKMPDNALRHKLPGITLRVCNFLKSRAQDIRKTARDTLVKAVQAIGADYLSFIIKEMRQVLTRGYQRHVLSYSVHHLLKSIKDTLKPGDLDPALEDLHAIYQEELFGSVAEEKTVAGIKAKVFEAKTIKGDSAYHMMAQFISPACIGALVVPLKKVLEGTHSRRVSNKVRTALQFISKGLLTNSSITIHTLMVFVHSLTADNLPFLRKQEMPKADDANASSKPERPEHCLLLAKAIPRGGIKPKTHKKTTLDVLVEFGLLLLHSYLKSATLKPDEPKHLSFLDPLIPSLLECLSLEYVRVNAAALRCFEWLLTFPLPTLKSKVKVFAEALFKLLRNYSKAGASQGDNQELVFTCFKAVTVLVREVKYFKPSNRQLEVLLPICEEDLEDITRQSTAFSLLKAILRRRLDVPALHELLSLVETKSITAEAQHLRAQCREVVMLYLKTYRLGKEIKKHFIFYAKHLRYELEDGRMSALKMLHSIFSTFDENLLKEHAEMFFVLLSVSLYSDESKACRTMAYETTKILLEKIDNDTRDKLFSLIIEWANKTQLMLPCIAAQLCGMFIQVEGSRFSAHMSRGDMFQIFLDKDLTGESDESQRDKYVFQIMTLILKMLKDIDLLTISAWTDVQRMFDYVEENMIHEHAWVRLMSSQIIGQILSLGKFTAYFSLEKGQRLIHKLCQQLQTPAVDEELARQVVKNLVFLAREYCKEDPKTVAWVTKKMVKEANLETINTPQETVKRRHVFTFIAAIGNEFDAEVVTGILPVVLPALQREEHSLGKEETLKLLAVEVIDRLKRKTGVEAFSMAYTSAQMAHREKKEKRKQKRAIDAVNNPEIAAAKRMKKNRKRNKPKREQEKKKRVSKTRLNIFHMDANKD